MAGIGVIVVVVAVLAVDISSYLSFFLLPDTLLDSR